MSSTDGSCPATSHFPVDCNAMSPLTPYPITPIGSFVGFILSILPLASHLKSQSWNTGILVYAFWVGTMNFTNFVNTIVWHDNVNIVIPVWCDIVTKLQVGAAIGIPACALVLSIHLFKLTRMRGVSLIDEKSQRRRILLIDLAITLGIPFLIMALWIVVQPSRFRLMEELGCQYEAYSYITYIIFYLPQLVFNLIAAILAPFTLQKFLRHRSEMNAIICSHSTVTPNKYLRVVIVTSLTLLLNLPILIVTLAVNIAEGPLNTFNYPYTSWDWIHKGNLNIVDQRPASVWGAFKWQFFTIKWDEWIYVLHAIIFFAIFGTTKEARRRYRLMAEWVFPRLGLKEAQGSVASEPGIVFKSNPDTRRPVRRGTFSFLDSHVSDTFDGRLTVSVRSVVGALEEGKLPNMVIETLQEKSDYVPSETDGNSNTRSDSVLETCPISQLEEISTTVTPKSSK